MTFFQLKEKKKQAKKEGKDKIEEEEDSEKVICQDITVRLYGRQQRTVMSVQIMEVSIYSGCTVCMNLVSFGPSERFVT